MPQVFAPNYASTRIPSNTDFGDVAKGQQPATRASRSPSTLSSGWGDRRTETNPSLTSPYDEHGAQQSLEKGAPGNAVKATPSRQPHELASGYDQPQAHPDFQDGSPARSARGDHGEPVDDRTDSTQPPMRSRTSRLKGEPQSTVGAPPAASSSARTPYADSRAEQQAFRTKLRG